MGRGVRVEEGGGRRGDNYNVLLEMMRRMKTLV